MISDLPLHCSQGRSPLLEVGMQGNLSGGALACTELPGIGQGGAQGDVWR